MPKKVKEEKEMEIDTAKEQKKPMTFVKRWFNDYAVNDRTEMKTICDLTARSAEEQFSIYLKSGNTEVYAVEFYVTFMEILEFIRSKEKQYNEFAIAICNSINVGYTNNDDENNEKVGNFMPILEYIGINRNIIDSASDMDVDKTTQNLIRWKEINVKKNVEFYKEIQEKAYNRLIQEYNTDLRTSEAIFPLFCIFIDHIFNVVKMKYRSLQGTNVSEVSMNVLGLFDIFYSYDEEANKEYYDLVPGIPVKLALKMDSTASRE